MSYLVKKNILSRPPLSEGDKIEGDALTVHAAALADWEGRGLIEKIAEKKASAPKDPAKDPPKDPAK